MRSTFLAAVFCVVAFDASAINRYETPSMTCAQVQSVLKREGAAILRYRSTRNPALALYGRYVRSEQFCGLGQTTKSASVPAADTKNCRVSQCVRIELFDNRRE